MKVSFYFWLKRKYKNENNLFGNLAELFEKDAKAPKRESKGKVIRIYLISKQIS